MTDYNALKVPDLKAMLGQRKLLQTGNKQALIARLQEDDEQNASGAGEAKTDTKEDEITYSDDDVTASKPAAEEATPEEPKPEELPKKDEAEAAAPAADTAAEATEPAAPAPSFAMGLASTEADEESKKRAERAKRFGIEENDDAIKRADRAKRFGLDQKELASGLDSALPERPLKRGRGRGGEGDGNRPGKRQSLDRRGRHGRGHRQGGGNRERGGATLDPAEKAKAEKRAARFATT
ncbi:hypothetical protein QQS21_004012 [Conoideocrella luteorostrata]|uniref:SAP domain-containing protein n=1 Tax=Conoideocrella luteorostrata TaxID=1105319 RepID=A0AAJ0CT79_9HYPO|nr:hypothetical protein QQS21_004012 [Conoideocrella luteorostrata]